MTKFKNIVEKLKTKFKWFKGFFEEGTNQSMMRLCILMLVGGGIIIVAVAVFVQLDGGHYGLELATLGILGKGYQKTQELKHTKTDGEDI